MPLVNMDAWLAERGLARQVLPPPDPSAAPGGPDPRDLAIDALTREVGRQSDLIRQLQAALKDALRRIPPPPPPPARRGRVKRVKRGPPPAPALASPKE
jgi:hypothetical protein